VPVPALAVSTIFLLIVVGISYVLPKEVLVYIASTAGVALILNWLFIALAYFRFRQRVTLSLSERRVRLPGFPYVPIAAGIILLIALLTSALNQDQLVGLVAGIIILLSFSGLYIFFIKKRGLQA